MVYFHRRIYWREVPETGQTVKHNAFSVGPGFGVDCHVTESLAIGISTWIYRALYEYLPASVFRHVGIHWTVGLGGRFNWSRPQQGKK